MAFIYWSDGIWSLGMNTEAEVITNEYIMYDKINKYLKLTISNFGQQYAINPCTTMLKKSVSSRPVRCVSSDEPPFLFHGKTLNVRRSSDIRLHI